MTATPLSLRTIHELTKQANLSEKETCMFLQDLYNKDRPDTLTERQAWDFISFLEDCFCNNLFLFPQPPSHLVMIGSIKPASSALINACTTRVSSWVPEASTRM